MVRKASAAASSLKPFWESSTVSAGRPRLRTYSSAQQVPAEKDLPGARVTQRGAAANARTHASPSSDQGKM